MHESAPAMLGSNGSRKAGVAGRRENEDKSTRERVKVNRAPSTIHYTHTSITQPITLAIPTDEDQLQLKIKDTWQASLDCDLHDCQM